MKPKTFIKKTVLTVGRIIPDRLYLCWRYRLFFKRKLNLKTPERFTEKIQWLKLYDRNPIYVQMADKSLVKEYVARKIGKEYIIPTLGIWDSFDDIDFNLLPNSFVLKCTHDSGGVYICTDKNRLNYTKIKNSINHSLKVNYFWYGREWVYKHIQPRIIAEKYMVDESGTELKDYKIFCFNGKPKLIQVDYNRFSDHKRNLYTPNWERVDAEIEYRTNKDIEIPKPVCLDKLLELSSLLSKGIAHLRTDFYVVNDMIYFGELTFYHGSGFERFNPDSLDYEMGSWMDLGVK